MARHVMNRASLGSRYLPALGWLRSYRRKWLRADVLGGITVWAVLIPEAMAYAGIAGVPPLMGLYTVPLPLFFYALLGSSRMMVVGPDSATALLSAGIVGSMALHGGEHFLVLTSALAVTVGVLFLLFGIFRLGWLANLVSRPVMSGFLQGIVLVTIIGQVPGLLGIEPEQGLFFHRLVACLQALPTVHGVTLAVGGGSLLLLLLLHRKLPRLPSAMVTVVVMTLLSTVLDLGDRGVAVTGVLATSLPPLSFPPISPGDYLDLVPGALTIVLLGYIESLGAAEVSSLKSGRDVDPDQELIALGLCNLGSGISSGFVAVGSLSKTSVAAVCGVKTQAAFLVSGILSLLTLLFLLPLLANLPHATLAAIVIEAMLGLDQTAAIRQQFRFSRLEGLLALVSLFGVLYFGVVEGVVAGVILSIIVLLERASHPGTAVLGRIPGHAVYRDVRRHPEAITVPGLLIFRFDSELVFPSSRFFLHQAMREVKQAPAPVQVFLINAETINDLDLTGAQALLRLEEKLHRKGIRLWVAQMQDPVIDKLRRLEGGEKLTDGHLYESVGDGVRAFKKFMGRHSGRAGTRGS